MDQESTVNLLCDEGTRLERARSHQMKLQDETAVEVDKRIAAHVSGSGTIGAIGLGAIGTVATPPSSPKSRASVKVKDSSPGEDPPPFPSTQGPGHDYDVGGENTKSNDAVPWMDDLHPDLYRAGKCPSLTNKRTLTEKELASPRCPFANQTSRMLGVLATT